MRCESLPDHQAGGLADVEEAGDGLHHPFAETRFRPLPTGQRRVQPLRQVFHGMCLRPVDNVLTPLRKGGSEGGRKARARSKGHSAASLVHFHFPSDFQICESQFQKSGQFLSRNLPDLGHSFQIRRTPRCPSLRKGGRGSRPAPCFVSHHPRRRFLPFRGKPWNSERNHVHFRDRDFDCLNEAH